MSYLDKTGLEHLISAIKDRFVTKEQLGDIPDGAVTTAKLADGSVTKDFTATIPSTGWDDLGNHVYVAVNVAGILASDEPIIDIDFGGTDDAARDIARSEAWGKILRIWTGKNLLSIRAKAVPSVPIPIRIRCIRK